MSDEQKEKLRLSNIGRKHAWTAQGRANFSASKAGHPSWNAGLDNKQEYSCLKCSKRFSAWQKRTYCSLKCRSVVNSGTTHYRWIKDRTKVKFDTERGGYLHKQWSKAVKARDSWKCQIANRNCDGRMEAHHILSWKDFPASRYSVNNGITLCHRHHPSTRENEQKAIPRLQAIISRLDS